jgi:hypothetical protein
MIFRSRGDLMKPACALVCLSFLPPFAAVAAAQGSSPRTVDAGVRQVTSARAPDGTVSADEIVFDGSLALLLRGQAGPLRIEGWPIAPGQRAAVIVEPYDVYAPGARIYRVDSEGTTEVPRSILRFFRGAVETDANTQVLITLDPQALVLTGFTDSLAGTHKLVAPGARGSQLLARSESLRPAGSPALTRDCGQDSLPATPTRRPDGLTGDPSTEPQGAIASLHTATVAVDTDNELMQLKFGDSTSAATTYLAQLFAAMNLMYERDLLVRLLQGDTTLRVSSQPDPYTVNSGGSASGSELNEFSNYWIANKQGVTRALAMLLSGKSVSANSASGIAWLDVLCYKGTSGSAYGGYSFSKVFRFTGSDGEDDSRLVGHELGHNFGSPHTHCTLPNESTSAATIDTCYAGQASTAGCFSGTPSCPATASYQGVEARGTVMSYCHLLSGCTASSVFHTKTKGYLDGLVQVAATGSGACVFPTVASGPPVINSFTVSPAVATGPGTATLSWSTTNATAVSLGTGASSTSVGGSGSTQVSLSSTTTYTLTATATGQPQATASVTVNVLPAAGALLAAPSIVSPNASQVLSVLGTTFQWSQISNAAGYELRIWNSQNGATVFTGSLLGSSSTSTLISLLAGQYTFGVRACNSAGFTDAACGSFGLQNFSVSPSAPTAAPAITAPAASAALTTSVQTLSWTGVG